MSSSPQRLTLSARVAVGGAVLLLFAVLALGFARLAGLLGVGRGETITSPVVETTNVPAAPMADPAGNAASASGRLADDPSAPTTTPGTAPTTTGPDQVPSPSSTAPSSPSLPPRWPDALPDPGQHTVVVHETDFADRWVLGMPGGMNLVAGRFLADLSELGWDVDTVVTQAGVTAVAVRGDERLSVVVRTGDTGLPANWASVEVIYQPRLPDFEVPPTSTTTPQDQARKGA